MARTYRECCRCRTLYHRGELVPFKKSKLICRPCVRQLAAWAEEVAAPRPADAPTPANPYGPRLGWGDYVP